MKENAEVPTAGALDQMVTGSVAVSQPQRAISPSHLLMISEQELVCPLAAYLDEFQVFGTVQEHLL